MSSWPDWYLSVWDALIEAIKTVEGVDKNFVFYGEKFPPNNYPSVFVCPVPIDMVPASTAETLNAVTFDIGVVTHVTEVQDDIKASAKAALTLIGKIHDKLISDRRLGGKCADLEVSRIDPNWRRKNTGMETFWAGCIVTLIEVR